MTKVVLQPCGKGLPAVHYADTVETKVPLRRMQRFLSDKDRTDLQTIYPEGAAAVWGVTPGKNDVSRTKWDRMSPGDVALFCREGRIFNAGTVAKKIHSAALARTLWNEDAKGNTWEYTYFLSGVHPLNITYKRFNRAAGYDKNNVIRGFNVLTETKSADILRAFNLGTHETANER